ncbi:hypothetical protein MN116_008278 [Schistosoma mekongi]|uniref:LisH domain-containing protein n=1 Tax=Schistosoma mekongi TaxID=38744 RepID=A0AAE1Z776_SCHME|nr:hypothetical protein MN116_008278 [Schistosoma mekongi]
MTDYFNLLPSEVSGLVLGFLRDSNCVTSASAFLRENIHLSEFRCHYATVNEIPLYFRELTLLDIIYDYVHIVNEVIPHLKKSNIPWQLGNLTASIAQLVHSLLETNSSSSNSRPKSFRSIHPVWMPLGKSYVPPRIMSADKSSAVRPPLATVRPSVTIASLPNAINLNPTSGAICNTLSSLDNSLTGLRTNRPVLRIYRQPLPASKTLPNMSNTNPSSSSSLSNSTLQTSQSSNVVSNSSVISVQSGIQLKEKSKSLTETLPTTIITTSSMSVLSPSVSCNFVTRQQSPTSTRAVAEAVNSPTTVQSVNVITHNENAIQSNDTTNLELPDNSSIFSVFSLLPPPSETLVTDMVICPTAITSQEEEDYVNSKNADNHLVSTKRRRNQPPRQLLSPGSGGSTLFGSTSGCEEELDMERFLSALFNNAEQVATRINTDVSVLNRNHSTYNHNDDNSSEIISQNIIDDMNSNYSWSNNNTPYKIISFQSLDNNVVKCSMDNDSSQPITDVYPPTPFSLSSSSSSSLLLSTSTKPCTASFICHEVDIDSSDSMQLWNDWFGMKGDLDTCIDHLLSDLESIEVITTPTTTTVTNTTVTHYTTITSSLTQPSPCINNSNTALIDIADHCSSVITSSYEIVTLDNNSTHHLSVSSSLSSSAPPLITVTVNSTAIMSTTVTTTTATTATTTTITACNSCALHSNPPMMCLSSALCNSFENNGRQLDDSLIISNTLDTKFIMGKSSISTTTVNQNNVHNDCNRRLLIKSSSTRVCLSQLTNNNNNAVNSQDFSSKRRCVRQSSDGNINTNNTINSSLPPVLITPDSKKNPVNEYINYELFHGNSPSCKLFKANNPYTTSNKSFQHYPEDHSSNYNCHPPEHQHPSHLSSLSSCYYSIPPGSHAQTLISSATNTCMTAYILSNPLPVIDLRQVTGNCQGVTINNGSNNSGSGDGGGPITFYTTSANNNNLTIIGNNVDYLDLYNNSLLNLIPVTCSSSLPCTFNNNNNSTAVTANPTSTAPACCTIPTMLSTTTGVVVTAVVTGVSDSCIQTVQVDNSCYYSNRSLFIDAKENHPPQPALIIQRGIRKKILNLQSLDIDRIISQSH